MTAIGHMTTVCECDLRHRAWNPHTGRCETCGAKFEDRRAGEPPPTTIVDQRTCRHAWDIVADHVERRGAVLGPAVRVASVIVDMRARATMLAEEHEGHGYMRRAYEKALDLVGHLAAELEAHGATIDDPIDVRAPASSQLVRVQALLWDHVRTVVQLRALIEEQVS